MQLFRIDRKRFDVVHNDISEGSEPALRFYILVAVSTLIASFGLISNSTAVVIGAMLVAPLMTPIFGISLGLVRGEPKLLGHALKAEIVGVAAAVTMGFVLGLFLGDFDPTPEMLARTRPNLFDLIVAVLAGFAGAYALVDEKISPALPGVAIATAIVPPLANSGLCLSLGEVAGGLGSFLLFFANFLSILIVGSTTFALSGMAKRYGAKASGRDLARRFGLPVAAFILITVFLGHSLYQIYRDRRIDHAIKATLIEELSQMPATALSDVSHYQENGKVHVLAVVNTPVLTTPRLVSRLQDRLTEQTGMPAELIMRCVLSNNISATGSVNNAITPRLDGSFVKTAGNSTLNAIATAEQIIREYCSHHPSLDLIRAELLPYGARKLMLAHVISIRPMNPEEIQQLQSRIRTAAGDDTINLIFSSYQKQLFATEGPLRYGWLLGDKVPDSVRRKFRQIRSELNAAFDDDARFDLVNVYATFLDDTFHFLLEITGPELVPADRIEALQKQLSDKVDGTVALHAWSRIEVVHGPLGIHSVEALNRYFSDRQRENLPEEIPMVMEASGR